MTSVIRVLIVDDHRVFAEALAVALEREADIQVAGPPVLSGDQVVDAASQRNVDVVLMEARLPVVDGIEATHRLRAARPATAVVILTADEGAARLPDAAVAGAVGFLDKTAALDDVGAAVRAAHAGEILLPEVPDIAPVPSEDRSVYRMLTPREHEVLALLAEGLSNRDIAHRLVLSVRTVDTHVHNVLIKLGVHSKLEAVVKAMRAGVLGTGDG